MQEVIGSNPIFSTNSELRVIEAFFMMKFLTYILYSPLKNKYYIGHTEHLERRLIQHNSKNNLGTNDWIVVHTEPFLTRADAMKRELEIKNKKSRTYIEWLIKQKD